MRGGPRTLVLNQDSTFACPLGRIPYVLGTAVSGIEGVFNVVQGRVWQVEPEVGNTVSARPGSGGDRGPVGWGQSGVDGHKVAGDAPFHECFCVRHDAGVNVAL